MQHGRVAIGHAMGWQVAIQVGPLANKRELPQADAPLKHTAFADQGAFTDPGPDKFGGPRGRRGPMETNEVSRPIHTSAAMSAGPQMSTSSSMWTFGPMFTSPEICTFRPTKTLLARLTRPPMDERLQTRAPGSILASGPLRHRARWRDRFQKDGSFHAPG